jgi:hypothetical protein
MKQVNIHVQHETVTLQLFDKWVAYRQGLSQNLNSDVLITFDKEYQPGKLNIWFDYMPDSVINEALEFDLVFLCNSGEPLSVSTQGIVDMAAYDHVFLCADGYVTEDHYLHHKIIWHPHDPLNCHDYWTRSFYPQYHTLQSPTAFNKTAGICGINGSNRSYRSYFWNTLLKKLPKFELLDNFSEKLTTLSSFWETSEDTSFREFVNSLVSEESNDFSSNYYSNSVTIGINQKFGSIAPGYFFLEEYFTYRCIVFPETSWQNNELTITEKALKCFRSNTFPMPIGGANVNNLYNSLGFYTAWNLLPSELKFYDSLTNHQERYDGLVSAVVWLQNNIEVFDTPRAHEMLRCNMFNFLTNAIDHRVVKKFDQWMNKQLP